MNKSLAEKGRIVKQLEANAAKLTKDAKKIKDEIKEELKEMGVKTIVLDGVQLTYVAPVSTDYSQEKLKENLPTKVYNRLFKKVFDPTLLEGEVLEGNVSLDIVNRCSVQTEKEPSVRITIKD